MCIPDPTVPYVHATREFPPREYQRPSHTTTRETAGTDSSQSTGEGGTGDGGTGDDGTQIGRMGEGGTALLLIGFVVTVVAYRLMVALGRLPEERRWFA